MGRGLPVRVLATPHARVIVRALVPAGAFLAFALWGCGAKFPLPTEIARDRVIPSDKSYQMLDTWDGMTDVADILLTQGRGSQLFILFNHGGTGEASRGEVFAYPLTRPNPITSFQFRTLFNPVALCSGGDAVTVPSDNRIFVLDQGDTCLARRNPATGICGDTTGAYGLRVSRLDLYWRVKEYRLLAGDTLTSFTDTTLAFVRGIAADDRGRVYVAGTAIVNVPSQVNPNLTERVFQYRVYRYIRGGPADPNMPGAAWHRDLTWEVEQGSGVGSLDDPRGIFWSPAAGGALYAADFGKNWIQKLDDVNPSTGFFFIDAGDGETFGGPEDVAVDLAGFIYVADTGNSRVLRYGPDATYIQRVDVELNEHRQPLQNPVAMAADDSLVYIADRGAAEVIRYKRRP